MKRLQSAQYVLAGALVATALLVGCGGGGDATPASLLMTPLPTPSLSAALHHMYVQYGGGYRGVQTGTSGSVVEYTLPLSQSSVPDAVLATGSAAFAVSAFTGQLAVAEANGIAIFNPPLQAAQKPAVLIPYNQTTAPVPPTSMSFDAFGNLWASVDALREFIPPFTAAMTSVRVNYNVIYENAGAPGASNLDAMQFTPDNTLYGVGGSEASGAGYVLESISSPTYSQPPKSIKNELAWVNAPLAFDLQGGAITVYEAPQVVGTPLPSPIPSALPSTGLAEFILPISSYNLPAAVAPLPGSYGQFDAIGTDANADFPIVSLYIGSGANANANTAGIYVYPLPLTNGETPSMHVQCPLAMVNTCAMPQQIFQYGP